MAAKHQLGVLPRPPSREVTDALYARAGELAALLRPLELAEKPPAFLRWLDARVDEWRQARGAGWMVAIRPQGLRRVRQQSREEEAREVPLILGGSATDVSDQIAEMRQTEHQAYLGAGQVQSIFIEILVRNTYYPSTLAEFGAFLDRFDAVLGHEILHAEQTRSARRDALRRKTDEVRIVNAPFGCKPLPGPVPPFVVPCYSYKGGKRRLTGYGIPTIEAMRLPQLQAAAQDQYLTGPEERTPWAYTIASELFAAGLKTVPEHPGDSVEHLGASDSLASMAQGLDWQNPRSVDAWVQVRKQARSFLRQLDVLTSKVDATLPPSRLAQLREARERRQAQLRARGAQRLDARVLVAAPAPQASSTRSTFIELD